MKANATVAIILPRHCRRPRSLGSGLATLLVVLAFLAARPVAAQSAGSIDDRLASADSAWKAGRYPEALAGYRAVVAADSNRSSRAVYRLAVLLSWDGDLARAIPLFRHYTRLEPEDEEGRIALGRAYAWNGQTDAAVAVYDSILGRDRTYRDAALGAAQALAWGARYRVAVQRYEAWLADNPRDVEAELNRARTLAWWGRLSDAERSFALIAERGERLEAEKGLALVAAWRGDLLKAETLWRGLVGNVPNDPEAWVGLAQVLRWSGRPDDAREALDRALAADPANSDAAAQLRWVRGELSPATDPGVSYAWDSDDNRSVLASGGVSVRPFRRARLTAGGYHRAAELGVLTGEATAGRVGLRVSVGRRATVSGDLGVTRMSANDPGRGPRTVATGSLGATVRITSRLSAGASARRSAFDETAALLRAGIDVRALGGEVSWEPVGRVVVAGGAEWASLRGGSGPNERQSAFAVVRWRPDRRLTASVSGRRLGYDERRQDGYFSPAAFELAEAGLRWTSGRELGFTSFVEAAAGAQRVRFDAPASTRGTQRAALGVGYRPSPGSELMLDYGFSNVSGTAAEGSIYRAQSLSLRARLLF